MEASMSQSHNSSPADGTIHDIEKRIQEQEAQLQRMIVRGTPTQAAEDQLRRLYARLREMKGVDPSYPDGRTLHRGLLKRPPRRINDRWPR
jgi:hypothetical protein